MSDFLITNPDQENNFIKPSELAKKVESYWIDASISSDFENDPCLSWTIKILNRRLDCSFYKNSHLSMDGELNDCSKFAIWYRKQVPIESKLVMFDMGYNADIQLLYETSEQEIIQTFLS